MEHSLAQFAAAIRMIGIRSATITYGSGGYCILLKNRSGKDFAGYSWDIDKAFELAKQRLRDEETEFADENTHVDYKFPK